MIHILREQVVVFNENMLLNNLQLMIFKMALE